ncbi:MAG: phosphoribosylformylglycinamidine synthase subunit PurQ [Opitutales bacterium]|jgi:phosphoribosylformylglycinamidine synthase I
MKVAILQFPGSNCDWDAEHAVQDVLGIPAARVWHKSPLPTETEAVIVPGGFSFGDYLRCGAIARFSPIMNDLKSFAENGGQILGICNGFQILCEAGLLPGALIRNDCLEFRCINQRVKVEDSNQRFSPDKMGGELIVPIAHGEGNYRLEEDALVKLESNKQVLLRYVGNPNGSINDIAGIRNEAGNVYGMMPHPERAVEKFHPSQDGLPILEAFFEPIRSSSTVELSAS